MDKLHSSETKQTPEALRLANEHGAECWSARDGIHHQAQAIPTHEQVGKEVRDAIKCIGGTLPEQIPPAEHIKEVEKRLKNSTPKLEPGECEAGSLLGEVMKKTKRD